jgi:hypothetical protein
MKTLRSAAVEVMVQKWGVVLTCVAFACLWMFFWLQPNADLKPKGVILWEILMVLLQIVQLLLAEVRLRWSVECAVDVCSNFDSTQAWAFSEDVRSKAGACILRSVCTVRR